MAPPRPTLGHYRGGSLTYLKLISCVLRIQREGHREPRNKVGFFSPAERLVGFEPGTFQFWSKHLNPLGHSLRKVDLIEKKPKQAKYANDCNKRMSNLELSHNWLDLYDLVKSFEVTKKLFKFEVPWDELSKNSFLPFGSQRRIKYSEKNKN